MQLCNRALRNAGPIRYFMYLDPARLERTLAYVQAALLVCGIFPPPSAGTNIFADGDGAGARCTTQAGVELVMQFVVGHIVLPDVSPHILVRPSQQRIEFLQAEISIECRYLQTATRDCLVAA